MRQLLWWLIGGSRDGKNRLRIVRTIHDRTHVFVGLAIVVLFYQSRT